MKNTFPIIIFLTISVLSQASAQVKKDSLVKYRHYLGTSYGGTSCFGILNEGPLYAPAIQLNYSLEKQGQTVYSARLSYSEVFEFQIFGNNYPANSLTSLELMVGKLKHYKRITIVPSAGIAIDRFAIRTGINRSTSQGFLSSNTYYNTEEFTRVGLSLNTAFKCRIAKRKHRYLYIEPNANINLYCPVYGFNLGFQGCL